MDRLVRAQIPPEVVLYKLHANGNEHHADELTGEASVSRLRYILTTGNECKVNIGPDFLQALADIAGENKFDLKAAKTKHPSGQSIGQ